MVVRASWSVLSGIYGTHNIDTWIPSTEVSRARRQQYRHEVVDFPRIAIGETGVSCELLVLKMGWRTAHWARVNAKGFCMQRSEVQYACG